MFISASISRECPNCHSPLQQMPLHRPTDIPHIQSRNFKIVAFILDPDVSKTACEPFQERNSFSYSTLGPMNVSSIRFLSQMFLGNWISSVDPECWDALFWATNPHSSGRRARIVRFPYCVLLQWGWGFWWDHVSVSTWVHVLILFFVVKNIII